MHENEMSKKQRKKNDQIEPQQCDSRIHHAVQEKAPYIFLVCFFRPLFLLMFIKLL